jgi:hypothetical protein
VASELWDFLSGGENTMEIILEIINTIATTDFISKFNLLQDNSQRNSQEYKNQLIEWNLFSELQLIENENIVKSKLISQTTRIYNKIIFDNKGNYNWERYIALEKLIK